MGNYRDLEEKCHSIGNYLIKGKTRLVENLHFESTKLLPRQWVKLVLIDDMTYNHVMYTVPTKLKAKQIIEIYDQCTV